jgi:muramoyltetrapeptide carboxypeptidase
MRGGWGCARMLDLLDYQVIAANPKIIMGFSDITSLINAVYAKTGMITYHGPCGYSSWGDFTKKEVSKALLSGAPFKMKNPPENREVLRTLTSGTAEGRLVGGNLTVIQSMIGTEYEPNWNKKILFLEEIGEESYRVDRMLWQLKQRKVFDKISGLVLGSFKDCEPEEPEKSFSLDEIFMQHFLDCGFPVYQGASFGHLAPKFTLPIGVKAEMDASAQTITTLEKSVV